ncbi:MAG TPA: FliM/FliN family flagellar motor switch protein [Bryobacteraceae bacterium]|jgi:flagellar motor switch protein FliM|nr:FliM/FliN family flagellar motor switch protein [Bryobacteraceae bacterium]
MENLSSSVSASVSTCSPGHLPDSAIARIQRIHRLFLKALEARLGDSLQSQVTLGLADTRQASMGSFLSAAADTGGYLLALDVAPTAGNAVLSYPARLLRAVLDILLARPSGAPAGRESQLTEIENHILRDFFDAFTGTLRKAWAPSFAVGFNRISAGMEDARQILNASAGDSVLVLTSRLKLAGVEYTFDLALPGFLIRLAEVRAHSAQNTEHPHHSQEGLMAGPLGSAVVELQGVLRGATLRMGDLLALKPQQVLFLGTPLESPFDCLVNGTVQFSGEMVAGANRPCFHVQGLHTPGR